MIKFLRKLIPRGAQCGGCGKQLYEWKRHPCPYCGSIIRNFGRFTTETMVSEDHSSQKIQK